MSSRCRVKSARARAHSFKHAQSLVTRAGGADALVRDVVMRNLPQPAHGRVRARVNCAGSGCEHGARRCSWQVQVQSDALAVVLQLGRVTPVAAARAEASLHVTSDATSVVL